MPAGSDSQSRTQRWWGYGGEGDRSDMPGDHLSNCGLKLLGSRRSEATSPPIVKSKKGKAGKKRVAAEAPGADSPRFLKFQLFRSHHNQEKTKGKPPKNQKKKHHLTTLTTPNKGTQVRSLALSVKDWRISGRGVENRLQRK